MLVWHAPLTPEQYDIVIDANKNGVYNAATDGLDSGSPGFVVLATLAAADASGDGSRIMIRRVHNPTEGRMFLINLFGKKVAR